MWHTCSGLRQTCVDGTFPTSSYVIHPNEGSLNIGWTGLKELRYETGRAVDLTRAVFTNPELAFKNRHAVGREKGLEASVFWASERLRPAEVQDSKVARSCCEVRPSRHPVGSATSDARSSDQRHPMCPP